MERKRDRFGRFVTVQNENREKVIRVTPTEFKAIQEARKKGIELAKVVKENANSE